MDSADFGVGFLRFGVDSFDIGLDLTDLACVLLIRAWDVVIRRGFL